MQCFSFTELIEIPKSSIRFRHADGVHLENQYGVFVFQDIREKQQFYHELRNSVLNGKFIAEPNPTVGAGSAASLETPKKVLISADPRIIVMECGSDCMEIATGTSHLMSFSNCATFADLLCSLRDILADKSIFRNSNLNTLIIENISAFYWQQKSVSSRELYKEINQLIGEIMRRYACNVMVTLWGVSYERGFNSQFVDQHPQTLAQATFTPRELFQGAQVTYFRKQRLA